MPKTERSDGSVRSRDDKKSKHKKNARERSPTEKKTRRDRSKDKSTSRKSPSQNIPVCLLKTLEEKRIQEHIERKRMKERLKSNETLEEKRARRLKEKQAKEQRKRQRMGWDTEYQLYTNQDNPFGDSNLTSTFVWDKKLEKDGLKDVSLETVEVLSKQKQYENKRELEKVKKRRMERELEKQMREEDMLNQQRTREIAQFQEWERQEDLFHFEQAKLRSALRIQDGRAKPIDLLAQYITSTSLEEGIEMQMHEPYVLLNGLGIKDLDDLLVDIKIYLELEKGSNIEFWNDMTIIVEDELQKLNKLHDDGHNNAIVGRREGIHQSVVKDVSNIFRGKNSKQLDELRARIESKIKSRSDGVDISYWESLLLQLNAHLARARLRDRHQQILRQKLNLLKKENEESKVVETPSALEFNESNESNDELENEDISSSDYLINECFQSYVEGNYSPKYIPNDNIEESVLVKNEEDDANMIQQLRMEFLEQLQEKSKFNREEIVMRTEARKGMMQDEAEFSVEAPLETPTLMASDKYRPRKPRYFNRVHTGFEWNKYNQTHYDMDNPPPKIVQGYKFNIFYPDLIDKSATPQYILTPCEDNADFAILRFHAGPPYEDIAFKIVNREWEFSYKRGFRCQFQNNIFQLWFHFKRYRYRR